MNYEKIFDESAKRNMLRWDIEQFKVSHPHLFKSIIEAMADCRDAKEDNVFGIVSWNAEDIKQEIEEQTGATNPPDSIIQEIISICEGKIQDTMVEAGWENIRCAIQEIGEERIKKESEVINEQHND